MSDQEFALDRAGVFHIELSKVNPETGAWFIYCCPCGCGSIGQLALIQPMSAERGKCTWNWDGNCDRPTLSPSIRRNVECKFHGHMQKGIWTACSDGPPVAKDIWRPGKVASSSLENLALEGIVDDLINQSPELEKLVVDMQSNPSLTENQILKGERLPPPEFAAPIAEMEREALEGIAPLSPTHLIFGESTQLAEEYAQANSIAPDRFRFVRRPDDAYNLSPSECQIVLLKGWDTDAVRILIYSSLKCSKAWRQYFKQHPELP